MHLLVDGVEVFAGTGGREFDPRKPVTVFLHGAGFDHTAFALQSRWFAHHGSSVLAPDFPGHGRSAGTPLTSIAALADWTAALILAAGASDARLIGHSMGSLVALAAAARHPDKVTALSLITAGTAMPVSLELLAAAKSGAHAAVDMMAIWGLGPRAALGGSPMPGLSMLGGAERILERARPGVLFGDLSACNDYRDGPSDAAKVRAPTLVVLGERDMMIPLKRGRALADAIRGARLVVIQGAGHLPMTEKPDELIAALRQA
jgi:pimeloyl-ACP methyl ester carboxylesterase